MRPSEPKKTIFKVIATRKTRELISLLQIIFGTLALIGLVCLGQLYVCKSDHPKRSALQCIAPRLFGAKKK